MDTFDLVSGILLLLAGRKLFWLCVGITGFLFGMSYILYWGSQSQTGVDFIFAIIFGVLVAILAVSFQWLMVVLVVGFLGGGYLLINMFPLPFEEGEYSWLLFAMGATAGTLLTMVAFDWALILISSLLGATFITRFLNMNGTPHDVIFIASMVVGILVQYMTLKHSAGQKHS